MSKYYDAINRNLATTREPLAPVRQRAKLVPKTRELVDRLKQTAKVEEIDADAEAAAIMS